MSAKSDAKWQIQRWNGICSGCLLKWGRKLLLGVKNPIVGKREALKVIRHSGTRQIPSFDVFFSKSERVGFCGPNKRTPINRDF
jgi:hypothetical protein